MNYNFLRQKLLFYSYFEKKKDMEYLNKNICALATPQGQGAIAVIRLSGEDTPEIVGKIFTPAGGKAPLPYKMQFGAIKMVKG